MIPSVALRSFPVSVVLALLIPAIPGGPQEQPQAGFLEVQITQDELYSYKNLKFAGDFMAFESPAGFMALGRTTSGVTVVIVLSPGTVSIEAPEPVRERFTQVMGGYPLKASFKTLYMRLHPKEFDQTIANTQMTKATDAAALSKAQEIFTERFLTSYHAGPKAILPPLKTRVFDFDVVELGMIAIEEGYWIKLNRLSPFGKIYPSNFVNPKQK